MIIFMPLILGVYLLLIAIDILLFFALIRLLHDKWTTPGLDAFNATGTPVVDWYDNYIEKVLRRFSNKSFSQKVRLSIGIGALALARISLTAVLCR
jgi:ABC-type Co2+ transport system permease subunit